MIQEFEGSALKHKIRLVETQGAEKKPVLFYEDQGETSHIYRPELEGSLFQ